MTGFILASMSVAMIGILSGNQDDFSDGECFLNRIEFSAEIALGFFIFARDVFRLCVFGH